MKNQKILLRSLKYPNHLHYEWNGYLLEKTDNHILVICKPGRKLTHYSKRKELILNNWSLEYFSLTDWFTAAININNHCINKYYCNIAMPSVFNSSDNILSFVDLDLDLIKYGDTPWEIVDEDEFIENSKKYGYSNDLINLTKNALSDLQNKIKNKIYPFNDEILDYIHNLQLA